MCRHFVAVWDATGKPEAGVLDGNGIFEGRYTECRQVMEPSGDAVTSPVQGMYCLASWWTFAGVGAV